MADTPDTFLAIVNAVLANRFKPTDIGQAQRWVRAEYQYIWNAYDWSFKHVSAFDTAAQLTIEAGNNTPSLPADFADLAELYDDTGELLEPLTSSRFGERYRGDAINGRRGSPEAYTIVGRTLYLGPTPDRDATFSLGYTRILSHIATSAGNSIVAGNMSDDSDAPLWYPSGSSEALIAGARARGKKRAQDATWQADTAERDELLDALLADFAPAATTKAEYGRDPL